MSKNRRAKQLFSEYFEEWIELYKVGAVRPITLKKYYISQQHIEKLVPDLKVCDITRRRYQKLLNDYAISHEKQTTMDFHHHLKGAILDAVDDGLIAQNPTRKIIIKGKNPRKKRPKFLNQHEVQALIRQMDLTNEINWDWFILLILKTGLRFSEALAVTPNDFDFSSQKLTIDKTWDYKSSKGTFQPTKNKSSKRKVQLDWQTAMQFSQLVKVYPENQPIFVKGRIFNSTVNNRLQVLCKKAEIPSISIHGLRHTHASLLLFADVSIATVARRLGHSSMSTTQETYLHIIQELENQDNDKIMRHLSTIG
ncbi:site-specific integrase [Lactococcus garvieae]|uniref:Site-specific integrase n=1 Tax=Lactococcus garvieae TaxID=1363 RepID=A0AA46TVG4_9LACT|nr:site-specific integrase [Lactococcus garvieae]UYT10357.1 site-specific integrase [Lactococcus garvieae]UYT12395.1 site-specific integrase [Lactococcus garvieae]